MSTMTRPTSTASPAAACCSAAPSRRWLANRYMLLAAVVVVALGGAAAGGWGWLVAAGIAPVLLSVLPCLIMRGLGLCMHRKMSGGSAEQATTTAVVPGLEATANADVSVVNRRHGAS